MIIRLIKLLQGVACLAILTVFASNGWAGNFYTNITVKGPGQIQVCDFLKARGRKAFVSKTVNGFTVVYDQGIDDQELPVLRTLLESISKHFQAPALAVLNHDDDILMYIFYNRGILVDEYNSSPGYFSGDILAKPSGGDAKKLCFILGNIEKVDKVDKILRKPGGTKGYLFAIDRHRDLAEELGLPLFSVGFGYNYIEQGELPDGLLKDELLSTP